LRFEGTLDPEAKDFEFDNYHGPYELYEPWELEYTSPQSHTFRADLDPTRVFGALFDTLRDASAESLLNMSQGERIKLAEDIIAYSQYTLHSDNWVLLLVLTLHKRYYIEHTLANVSIKVERNWYQRSFEMLITNLTVELRSDIVQIAKVFGELKEIVHRDEKVIPGTGRDPDAYGGNTGYFKPEKEKKEEKKEEMKEGGK
jgi:hypothetical protein